MESLLGLLSSVPTPVLVIFGIAVVIGLIKKAFKALIFVAVVGVILFIVGTRLGII